MTDTNKQLEDMERLFLLELLVDNVQVSYEKIGLDACELSTLKQACVRFQFLNYPVLEICEEDFCNISEDYTKDQIEFKSGKSCLFSLRGIAPDVRCFEICVTVLRQKTTGHYVLLGRTRISLGSSFTNILTAMENDCSTGPIARTSKDTHPLLNEKGEIVGKITVFVRLSCFGKMIITQFQVSGEENKSFLFKGASDTKGLPDLGGLGDQSTIADPFARGGDEAEASKQPTTPSQGPTSAGQSQQGYYPDMPGGPMGGVSGMSGDMGPQGMMPGALPGSAGTVPENMPGMPGSAVGMPGMPGTAQGIPGMPGSAQGMPGFAPGMPGMPGFAPGMPGMYGSMPGSVPGMSGGMPGSIPGMAGNMPGSMPGMPGRMPGMPPMPGAMSGSGEGGDSLEKNYKEIGVEINGHSLSIKIPRREKKPKTDEPQMPFCGKVPIATSETSTESSEEDGEAAPQQQQQQQQPQMPGIEFCGCDYPLPPGFGCPPPPPPPKKKKKKKKPKCPLEVQGNYCMKPDCPMGYPALPNTEKKPGCPQFDIPGGAVGVKGEQVVFQMPTGHQGTFPGSTNAAYNFGGNLDTNLQKVQMMGDAEAGRNVVPDPANDIFLLKVGKKNVATDRRAKMQVELKSPRKVETKMVDDYTQYVDADAGVVEDKKAGGKGGKGKGKGKGKKK